MECVASEVGHIVLKLVVLYDDVRSLSFDFEVWLLDMNCTTSRANIFVEAIVREYDRAFVALNKERRHLLKLVHENSVVEIFVWVLNIILQF